MAPRLNTRGWFRESIPIAVVLVFWLILSWFGGRADIATGIRYAGLVMGGLYAVLRGAAIGRSSPAEAEFEAFGSLLRVNVAVALPAVFWFVAARSVYLLERFWQEADVIGFFSSPAEGFAFALTATGVLTVVMYATAIGVAKLRSGTFAPEGGQAGTPSADD